MVKQDTVPHRPSTVLLKAKHRETCSDKPVTALAQLLNSFRSAAQTEREKGSYFERLVKTYLQEEPSYQDLFGGQVFLWEDWRKHCLQQGQSDPGVDAGIDLVAVEATKNNPRIFAIQAKFYAEDAKISKAAGIDSFLSAMGKAPFTNGMLVLTTFKATEHVVNLVQGRDKPVNIIALSDLEASLIDWSQYLPEAPVVTLRSKKSLRPHQQSALNATLGGFQRESRGKLIMACGTGKTFTSLKIAEAYAGAGKRVLFLVPSLSLLSQTLTEWTQESATPLHSFAVCSDSDVGKKKGADDFEMQVHELRYPATTDPARLALEMNKRHDGEHMSVVFSTYHSIDTISQAQQQHGLPAFDLIVCDEAHRTTGATFGDDDESNFVKVHDAAFIKATKRLYMTATPRIYGDNAKVKAETDNVALCSMDDPLLYGPELYVINFSEAVRLGLLCDYKVVVLAIEESHVSRRIQDLLKNDNNELRVDDAAKIIGCWKALAKQGLYDDLVGDGEPMKRAVAFCQVIEHKKGSKTHKVSSKQIAGMFQAVVEAYQASETDLSDEERSSPSFNLVCEADHVDGSMNASEKETLLSWLKEEPPENTCRVLSNVRCLSEGVDVPALDAVLFLTPRNSQVDVVQSVGRVMRNAPGKKRGYVVLPVVIPAGVEPHEALNDNQTYKVVWQVLQALRSHDDKFDALVNKLDLIGRDPAKMEVIAITDKVDKKQTSKAKGGTDSAGKARKKNKDAGRGGFSIGNPDAPGGPSQEELQGSLQFEVGEVEKAIYAKLVQKVGNRHHWEDWANDIAKIARTHIDRIQGILDNPGHIKEKQAFEAFAAELRDDLNGSISDGEIVEMLAQHLITKPVFDALFANYSFAEHNPMSKAMQGVLDALHEHRLDKEADTLQRFYDSVKLRAEGIDSAQGKQKIIVELYNNFFAKAFPRLKDKLGIVYTPVPVVDFILHSVNDLLQQEFGQTLGSKGVHIIDPFTGTGTFITRLLQSGLISPEELTHKYKHEIHANEIVLLAYYIAAINIEASYHSLVGGKYVPFEGICLTDTFQMYEKDDLVSALTVDNSARRKRQKKLDIRVIVGNPPYSKGQDDANDNNANIAYPHLDEKIRLTYAARSRGQNKNGLYNNYVRAIRWASDRIGDQGIVGFVTNGGWIEGIAESGIRRCLAEEFSTLYVFHLRGNQYTSGELSRREGGKIFGSGSRAPIAISLLVKKPNAAKSGHIYFHDIGDYLSREEKLAKLAAYASLAGITVNNEWGTIIPDEHGDWLKQRDDSFGEFIALGNKDDKTAQSLFENYSNGVKTQRDAWAFNASQHKLQSNMQGMIGFYNAEVNRFNAAHPGMEKKAREDVLDSFIDANPQRISWTRALKQDLAKGRFFEFEATSLVPTLYRPFMKQWLYFNRRFNEMVYQMPRIFPERASQNLAIAVSAPGFTTGFCALMVNLPPELCFAAMKGGTQCFPFYLYDEEAQKQSDDTQDMFAAPAANAKRQRREAITDGGLAHFHEAYPDEAISKEDLFYYVYSVLHSPDYRERFADNLSKELPRIPRVKTAADFWAFSRAGRALADLHLNYETVQPYPVTIDAKGPLTDADYRVEKMKLAKKGDKSTVIYNGKITVRDIPETAWDYVVNGKAALDWVMERQCVKTDKDSGIVNDANDWAIETMGNPKYPLELFQRVVTVSLETQSIVAGLPKLDI